MGAARKGLRASGRQVSAAGFSVLELPAKPARALALTARRVLPARDSRGEIVATREPPPPRMAPKSRGQDRGLLASWLAGERASGAAQVGHDDEPLQLAAARAGPPTLSI